MPAGTYNEIKALEKQVYFLKNEVQLQKKTIEDKDLYLAELEVINKELQEEVDSLEDQLEN